MDIGLRNDYTYYETDAAKDHLQEFIDSLKNNRGYETSVKEIANTTFVKCNVKRRFRFVSQSIDMVFSEQKNCSLIQLNYQTKTLFVYARFLILGVMMILSFFLFNVYSDRIISTGMWALLIAVSLIDDMLAYWTKRRFFKLFKSKIGGGGKISENEYHLKLEDVV